MKAFYGESCVQEQRNLPLFQGAILCATENRKEDLDASTVEPPNFKLPMGHASTYAPPIIPA